MRHRVRAQQQQHSGALSCPLSKSLAWNTAAVMVVLLSLLLDLLLLEPLLLLIRQWKHWQTSRKIYHPSPASTLHAAMAADRAYLSRGSTGPTPVTVGNKLRAFILRVPT